MHESELPIELRNAIAELLYHAQMIESLLRVHLSHLYEAADGWATDKGFRFKMRVSDLEKTATLGRLVDLYAKHTDNEAVVTSLRKFVKVRNQAAHNAFVWAFINREKDEAVLEAIARTREEIETARKLVHVVTLETMRSWELKNKKDISPPPRA